ncbi:MAG: VCBS repeat-containing protein, partial [Flavobacteriales bacterium]
MSINNWPGAFTPLYSTMYADIAVLGDIDLDGQLDLVGRQNDYELRWWPALNGQMDTIGDLANYSEWLEVFDLDQDGDSDVVSFSSGHVNFFLNDTANGFAPGLSITCPTFYSKKTNIVDLDGDGLPDIVLFMTSDSLAIIRNLGNGNFDPPVNIFNMNGMTPGFFADINNDGRADLVTDGAWWYAGLPALQFGPARGIVFTNGHDGTVSWGDMDSDGDIDIIQNGLWLEQTAPAVLDLVHTTNMNAINTAPADLNGNGQLDCYTFWVDGNNSELVQYMHADEGAWPGTQIIAGYGERSEVLTWDPDGDGDVDLLQCIFGNGVRGFRNDGQGAFSVVDLVGNDAAQAFRPAIADFDGDGDADFAAIGGGYLLVYSNGGNWGFSTTT